MGREGGGDLDGGPAEAGIKLVELLHEGAGLGVNEFGGFLKQAQLGLAGGFEAVEDDAGFDVGVAGLPEAVQDGGGVADQVGGAAGGGGQGELRGTGMRRGRGAETVLADEDGEHMGHGTLAAQLLGGAGSEGGHCPANVGLFGERAQDINTVPGSGNQGWNGVFRATIAPINTAGRLLHIGGGFRYHNPEDSQNALRFSAVPESTVANVGLLDTGFLGGAVGTQNTRISDFRQYGVELVGVWGPASVQGEWIRTDVSRNFGVPDVSVQGWYATASYFLTGESRPYRGAYVGEQAVMQRPTPRSAVGKGGYGAWELAARFSELDLTDASAALESQRLRGGREDNFTFGLNWYPTDTVRVLADYTHILSLSRPGIAFDDLNADIFELRAQLDWD